MSKGRTKHETMKGQTSNAASLSRGLLYVTQNTRDTLNDTPPRLLCYALRAT